ncbi:hypothetical protein JL2886_00631 [Phaeobacter gallaeciensis]|uniref:Alpha/beta hydrolase n=1 Tax=Phaeobacter gallaeciensis TaxID=60890 RepID=A0A1B0ZN78_9RHOB|nr:MULTISPECIES: hypothetical protein [Phaeobacter]MDF1773886.1 hypothetical protein [Pseudophaeobacter sp. bin_em_oilr2.035]MEE2634778.1 hypothetical protein [Pseudomonadota bacterium]ANP35558.1 hypothetical protein JL2886_00631 [Phaeobacter gallaeciensis]MDE4063722.1 hypothetical protein [Phaeobacter gallaeciensis]MDE4126743.1 hypothetical protein [Phaeobacter gallaeciensis]
MINPTPRLTAALRKASSDDPGERLSASRTLVAHGLINTAEPVLQGLADNEALAGEATVLLSACRYIRRVLSEADMKDNSGNAALSNEAERDILLGQSFDDFYLLKRAQGSSNLIVVFTGMARSFGVSLALLLRILKRFDSHVIFLQDTREQYYFNGVAGLGGTYAATLDALRQRAAEIGARNIWCLGQSGGGYAAIQVAIDLRARGVLAFVPATSLETLQVNGTLPADGPDNDTGKALPRPLDLVVQLQRADIVPHISIVYGALAEQDAVQAQRLVHPAVELVPIEGFADHAVFSKVVADNRLDDMIQHLFASQPHDPRVKSETSA